MKVSVIIPAGRRSESIEVCLDALLRQEVSFDYEIILAGTTESVREDPRVRVLKVDDLNPAVRRNRAAAVANGEILAFIDDDATAETDWLGRAVRLLENDHSIVVAGGPDPAPVDSTISELFSDTLLSAPWIGSGVLCHEGPEGMRDVDSAHDLALVNLFVRREQFVEVGGFDETIGYIGEDSDLVGRLIERGRAVYCSNLVVYHRRRRFPFEYVLQRWRYRAKMGESLLEPGSIYRSSSRIWIFLAGTLTFFVLVAIAPRAGIVLFLLYVLASLIAGSSSTRLSVVWWPLIPFAFMIHHSTYFLGITWGLARGLAERVLAPKKAVAGTKDR